MHFSDEYSKMLVLGGTTEINEIIDFGNPNSNCKFPNFNGTKRFIHSILREQKYPLSCASENDKNPGKDCYLYQKDGKLKTHFKVLNGDRKGSASAYVPNIGWWFTGGIESSSGSTSEIINIDSLTSETGPNLPSELSRHCMVQINETHTFVIGGGYGGQYFAATRVYNWEVRKWVLETYLHVARNEHSCGLYQNKKVIVAGGYTQKRLGVRDGRLGSCIFFTTKFFNRPLIYIIWSSNERSNIPRIM